MARLLYSFMTAVVMATMIVVCVATYVFLLALVISTVGDHGVWVAFVATLVLVLWALSYWDWV